MADDTPGVRRPRRSAGAATVGGHRVPLLRLALTPCAVAALLSTPPARAEGVANAALALGLGGSTSFSAQSIEYPDGSRSNVGAFDKDFDSQLGIDLSYAQRLIGPLGAGARFTYLASTWQRGGDVEDSATDTTLDLGALARIGFPAVGVSPFADVSFGVSYGSFEPQLTGTSPHGWGWHARATAGAAYPSPHGATLALALGFQRLTIAGESDASSKLGSRDVQSVYVMVLLGGQLAIGGQRR